MEYIKSERDDLRKDVTTLRAKLSEINTMRRPSYDSESKFSPSRTTLTSKISIGTQTLSVSVRNQNTQTLTKQSLTLDHFTQTMESKSQSSIITTTSTKACQSTNHVLLDTGCQVNTFDQFNMPQYCNGTIEKREVGIMTEKSNFQNESESYATFSQITGGELNSNTEHLDISNSYQSPILFDHTKETITEIYYDHNSSEADEEL